MRSHGVVHCAAVALAVLCSLAVCDQEAAGLAEAAAVAEAAPAAPQESEEPQEKQSEWHVPCVGRTKPSAPSAVLH